MTDGFNCGILGTGSFVPPNIITNEDLEKMVDTSDEWIVSRTGIKERRVVDKNVATSDIAAIAAQRAIKDAGIDAKDLDLIIVATVTPDMSFPSTACLLQDRLGAVNAAAFDLEAACSGFLYGIITAKQFIITGTYKNILVIGAECLSKIINWKDRNTCVLFGDGAGAAVLGRVEEGYGILSNCLGADGAGGQFLSLKAGGSRLPASVETVEQGLHYVSMKGNEVFKFAVKIMASAAEEAVNKAGLTADDIDYLVPHQANIRIIDAARKRLKLDENKVYVNLDRYGNMSSASIPVALDEAVHSGKIKKGHNIVMVGFGGGLTWGSCLMKWGK
ncbi:MAG: ketoacyl-ACP synthase III [Xylanivirga thermophila]|uniref:beta-ketoacyl-ACP synthase III n=1 Tax=Xylanivirga thermophila TaxID=2496273 RepID=UPI00101CB027|nr:beta-ketoacyl-ACP synthase III [Xylanivirga thermophila]